MVLYGIKIMYNTCPAVIFVMFNTCPALRPDVADRAMFPPLFQSTGTNDPSEGKKRLKT